MDTPVALVGTLLIYVSVLLSDAQREMRGRAPFSGMRYAEPRMGHGECERVSRRFRIRFRCGS